MKNYSSLLVLFVLALQGCGAPSIKDSAFTPANERRMVYYDVPKIGGTLAIYTFEDDRPSLEKRVDRSIIKNVLGTTMTLGLMGLDQLRPESKGQPFSDVDNDIPDVYADQIHQARFFAKVVRLRGTDSQDYKQVMSKAAGQADYVMVGKIRRFWGDWNVGRCLSNCEGTANQNTVYELNSVYGITYLSLQILSVRDGSILWSGDVNATSADNIKSNTSLGGRVPEQNRLAALSFKNSIKQLLDKLYAASKTW